MATNENKPSGSGDKAPPLKKHDIKLLDLAFAMDCTGSMGSYIDSARDNIRKIVDEIVAGENSDIHMALVEYRDHPPQDSSFVTRTHDFTGSPSKMREWLGKCSASGGGDTPEAVADALHDILKLSWREEATKICVCVSDAPPHGLNASGDQFPNGCPAGIDPMEVANKMAEKGITLYMVGCEPSICPYKDFFMALAYITGGQYVPLGKAKLLTQVIVGGAQEEMSLEQLMEQVNEEAQADIAAGRDIDEEELTRRVHGKFQSQGIQTKQLRRNNAELQTASDVPQAMSVAKSRNMQEVRKKFKPTNSMGFAGAPMMGYAGAPKSMKGRAGAPMIKSKRRSRGGPPPPPAMCAPQSAMMGGGMMAPPPPGSAFGGMEEEETYEVLEEAISMPQASRMVQKCMQRNKLSKK